MWNPDYDARKADPKPRPHEPDDGSWYPGKDDDDEFDEYSIVLPEPKGTYAIKARLTWAKVELKICGLESLASD
jgi:hypothetical protein